MDRLNIDRMPGGNSRLEFRKPYQVDARFWAHSADESEVVGPFTEDGFVEMPSSIGSFDISLDIPAQ
jgi:hypothetical protein